ncbi:MAG TPA: aminotransferase class IV, partial [bacterium]|nr:aminotransferase class IV [bacterium]
MNKDWTVWNFWPQGATDTTCVSALDVGFLYGDGLFETVRFEEGQLFFFQEHIDRLQRSCLALQIQADLSCLTKNALERLLEVSGLAEGVGRLKILVARGTDTPTILAMARQEPKPLHRPVQCRVFPEQRSCPMARHKTLSYSYYWYARKWAQANGCDYAILVDPFDHVLEADMANLFLIEDDLIIRPFETLNRLVGVVEQVLLTRVFPELGLACEQRLIQPEEITQECSLFLTNSMVD